jgi:putative ABC transport system permease protein
MGVIWQKVWFDLWHHKTRTTLAVFSIAAGVFAIGAMFGMADQMLSSMDAAHQAVVPAHIQMYLTQGIDDNQADQLRKIEGVEGIELGNFSTVRYRFSPDEEWDSAWLVMREDYEQQSYDIFQLKGGRWPETKELGIERLSSQYYGIDIGDQVIFDVEGRDDVLPITGLVRHPFVPPPQFGGPAVFFIDAEGLERFGVPTGEYGQLLVRVTPYSDDLAREVASEIKDRLAKVGVGVAITNYQDPLKHWGRPFMEGMNLVLQVLSVVTLGASAFLILNILTALLTQQRDQIGIIKAIGGRTGTIMQVYLAGVLVYGTLALLVGLPLGALLAFGISQYFLNLFNIDYEVFRVSQQTLIIQAMAATAVPLVSALWPVISGARITVREAIASYGLGSGHFGANRLDRLVDRVAERFLSAVNATAIGNLFRRKDRLIVTQAVLVIAGAMFMVVTSLSASITWTLDNEFARRHYDTTINFKNYERSDRSVALAESVSGVERAEVWYAHNASILKEGQRTREAGFGVQIIGIPAASDMFQPLIVGGRWLRPEDERAVVLNVDTAEANDIAIGDVITLDAGELGTSDWQVIGYFSDLFEGGIGGTESIYANQEAVFRATKKHNQGALVYVRTSVHDAPSVDAITTRLKDLYNAKNLDTDFSQTMVELRRMVNDQFSIVTSMLMALAVIVAVVGGIGLAGSLSISVVERTREIGVMRAIGARSHTMMGMFILEGVLQGIISWAIVIPLSMLVGQPLATGLGQAIFSMALHYHYNFEAVFIWLGLILVISFLASILPARSATKISVRESLAYA